MRIAELMTQPAVTCATSDNLSSAAQLMWDHDCGALPVVDGDGRVVGVITDRDICMAAYTQGRTLHAIPVRTAMSQQVVSCRAEETLDAVCRAMSARRIRRVPIVDRENRPVGIVSINDLAREARRSRGKDGADERDVVRTLAAISEPRSQLVRAPERPEREVALLTHAS